MSAGSIARPETPSAAPARRAGHTRITSAALHRTVEAIAAHAFGVPPGEVTARISDAQAHLSITLAVALPVPALTDAARNPGVVAALGGTLYQRAERARAEIMNQAQTIAGVSVAHVDIRLTGVYRQDKGSTLR